MRSVAAGAALVLAGVVALGGCATTVAGTASPNAAAPAGSTPSAAAPPSASGAPAAPAGAKYTDAQNRFGMIPPKDWKADPSGAQGTAVIFRSPTTMPSPKGAFTPNINVLVVGQAGELADTVAGARQELKGLGGYQSNVDTAVTLTDGTAAHQLGGTFTDAASGLALRNLQLFTVHNGSTVVVTGTALVDGWDAFGVTFDSSMRTLTVTP